MGSVFKQQYHAIVNGETITRESSKWYIQWKVGPGQYRRRPAYVSKRASEKMLDRYEEAVGLRSEGLINEASKAAGKPIKLHVRAFVRSLRDKGDCQDHRKATLTRIKRICKLGRIRYIGQITKGRVNKAIAILQDPKKWPKPISEATANGYRTAIKSFTAWLDEEHRLKPDPLSGLHKKTIDESQRVKIRRPLTGLGFAVLLETTAACGEDWEGVAPVDRVAIYILASMTGFRRRELSSVRPDSFTYGDAPVVTIARGYSKRRRTDTIPLKADVAEFFRRYMAGRPADQPPWKRIARLNTAKMLQADLDRAKIPYQHGKEVTDFHSLRQKFAADLARKGVVPKLLQKLTRHSDANLAMNVYAVLERDEERDAVQTLPTPEHLTRTLTQNTRQHQTESPANETDKGGRGNRQKKHAATRKTAEKIGRKGKSPGIRSGRKK